MFGRNKFKMVSLSLIHFSLPLPLFFIPPSLSLSFSPPSSTDISTHYSYLFIPRYSLSYAVWMGHVTTPEEAKSSSNTHTHTHTHTHKHTHTMNTLTHSPDTYGMDFAYYADEFASVLEEIVGNATDFTVYTLPSAAVPASNASYQGMCVCVCVYVCMYACVCVCEGIVLRSKMIPFILSQQHSPTGNTQEAAICSSVNTHIHTLTHTHTYTHIRITHSHTYTNTHEHSQTRTHIFFLLFSRLISPFPLKD